jgi:hypothetical protein
MNNRISLLAKFNAGYNVNLIDEEDIVLKCSHNGYDIQFVDNPSDAAQLAAVKNNIEVLYLIPNPSVTVYQYVLEHQPSKLARLNNLPLEILVQYNREKLNYINIQHLSTEELEQLVLATA